MTTNPPHPLIKAVDNELVLRGMAYSTRKSYGQHLRNHFDWLARTRLTPEQATRERIRAYLVEKASSGLVSAGYCRQARGIDTAVRDSAEAAGQVHDLPRMKRPKQLPIVLSREEVARLLKVVYNLKRKIAANTGKCRDTRKFCCGEYEFCDTRDHRHGGLGVGIGSITLLITWYLLSRQWYGYQAIAFYRMREIETDLGLWHYRYSLFMRRPHAERRSKIKEMDDNEKVRFQKMETYIGGFSRIGLRAAIAIITIIFVVGWIALLVREYLLTFYP